MSVIEDTRKLLQDFLAPELRELSGRVEALETKMDMRFEHLETRMEARFREVTAQTDGRFKSAEDLASERHSQTIQAINRLADIYELRERITRIEARERAG